MTKKDYEGIAKVIRDQVEAHKEDGRSLASLRGVANSLATYMGRDNLRFQPSRFLEACGL